jgi:ABC-2 type transport system permease protein
MMKEISLILSVQLKRLKNIALPLKRPFIIKASLLFIFVMSFEIGIYFFFNKVFGYLLSEEAFNEYFVLSLVERLMGMVFLMAFSMLIFSNILSTLSVVYLSRDLPLLISSPLRINSIFKAKCLVSSVTSSYTVVLIMIPIFLSYAHCFKTGMAFLIPALLTLLLFIAFSSGLGTLITIILMRFFPAKRAQQVVTVLGLFMIIVLVSAVRMMRPERLLSPSGGADFAAVVKSITVKSVGYFPGTWASRAILGTGQAEFDSFLKGFIPLLVSSILIISLVFWISRHIYYRSWALSGISRRGGKTERSYRRILLLEKLYSFLPPKLKAMFAKDTLLFFRETTQWSQLLILGGLVFIYLLNIKSLPLDSIMLKNLPARGLIAYLNIAFMGFIIATVVARFGYPAVSFEGQSIWIIRSLPIRYRSYLWTKFMMFFFPLLFMVLSLMFASNRLLDIPPLVGWVSLGTIVMITFALTGLGVGLGAAYPRFKYENAVQIITGAGGLIFMVISLFYIGIAIILLAIPGYQYFSYLVTGNIYLFWPSYLSLGIFIILSVLLALIPMEFGLKKWKKLQL